jgi:hypothetical protein
LPGGPLVEHALAIKGLAQADMPAFKAEGLLQEEDLVPVDPLVAEVTKGLENQATRNIEARAHTDNQAQALHDLKDDRRRLGHCVDRAFRGAPELAVYRQGSYYGSSIAATCSDVHRKLAFAKEHPEPLSRVGVTAAFIAKLESEVAALEKLSGAQDTALAQLPDSTRAYYEAKGRLYNLTKDIISAGRALHSHDPEAAAKYNSKLLYRKTGKTKVETEGTTGTGTVGTVSEKK